MKISFTFSFIQNVIIQASNVFFIIFVIEKLKNLMHENMCLKEFKMQSNGNLYHDNNTHNCGKLPGFILEKFTGQFLFG